MVLLDARVTPPPDLEQRMAMLRSPTCHYDAGGFTVPTSSLKLARQAGTMPNVLDPPVGPPPSEGMMGGRRSIPSSAGPPASVVPRLDRDRSQLTRAAAWVALVAAGDGGIEVAYNVSWQAGAMYRRTWPQAALLLGLPLVTQP